MNIVAFYHMTDAWLVCVCVCDGAAREYCGSPTYDKHVVSLRLCGGAAREYCGSPSYDGHAAST